MIRRAILCASLVLAAPLVTARADAPASTKTAAKPQIQVVELPAQPIVFRLVKAPPAKLEEEMRGAFLALVGIASRGGLALAGSPIARYRERAATSDATFVVEAALPVTKLPAKSSGFELGTLPAGPAITLEHRGKLADLPRAHAALDAWLVANKRRAAGPRWEVFVTNPVTTPDPAAQIVKIVVPLAPAT
ncbi:MAG: GyrI-like domain-containing protein [Kofleriaceae bacterium]|nr:GyrI-like domain-containing protein [Kofleriaceae bacterium]